MATMVARLNVLVLAKVLHSDLVMKAARIHAYGHSDQIRLEDVAQPEPSTTELLVRIHDAGVNPVDWKIREGYFAQRAPRPLPFTLGQDFCGVVLAVGAAIEDIEAGDEIYGFANGTYAEYATVSSEMFASKPFTTHGRELGGVVGADAAREHEADQDRSDLAQHGVARAPAGEPGRAEPLHERSGLQSHQAAGE